MLPPVPGMMPVHAQDTQVPRALSRLIDLHTATVDALVGFQKMVEKAEPEFRPTALRFRDLHADQAAELVGLIAHAGGSADREGSIMGTVNKAVVATRAFFDDIDAAVMDQVRSGEASVLQAFDDAIEDPVDPATDAQVRVLRQELAALLAETKDL